MLKEYLELLTVLQLQLNILDLFFSREEITNTDFIKSLNLDTAIFFATLNVILSSLNV